MHRGQRTLILFNHDWDVAGFARQPDAAWHDSRGFDLFSFPSNVALAWFDFDRFTRRLAAEATRRRWGAVTSSHEQFGALAAALVAERLGWPGTPVDAVLACQHKLHAREVLAQVAPEATPAYQVLDARYGAPAPAGLDYPQFVKPVKAAFSVLARTVHSREELHAHTRFGRRELWIIRRLVEPFERVAHQRLRPRHSAHRLMLEEPVAGLQYNLDGYVFQGQAHAVGVVDAVMYPGTHAFMRFDLPSHLDPAVQQRALDVAQRFLAAVGFTHGLFNMEFFHDPATDRLSVIEFNPRMAAQFSDLYLRVLGLDLHAVALALARGQDPAHMPRHAPTAGAASSLVYRSFGTAQPAPPEPNGAQRQALAQAFPDALLFTFPKQGAGLARDHKWLGSHRYGIVHLGGRDAADLRGRGERASQLLGWPAPFGEL
ncbi:MAG: ATP-grasp domain-containing protein [Burkholderiaceae bacterium]